MDKLMSLISVSFGLALITPCGDCFSNAGKTFYQTFNSNYGTANYSFILSTEATTCTIKITVDTPPLTTYSVTISKAQALVHQVNVTPYQGVKLEAPCDFVVYGLNYYDYSADGWMAIPLESLGTKYVVLGVNFHLEGGTQLSIVATTNNTTCTCTFPNGTREVVALNAMQVKAFKAKFDFTGTTVVCNNKVSVLTGHISGYVPTGCLPSDHMVEQIPPKSTLGRNFALVPMNQGCAEQPTCCKDPQFCEKCFEIYVILAVENDTQVIRNGTETNEAFTLQAGEHRYILLSQSEVSHLVSTRPVILTQYINSLKYQHDQFDQDNTDPSFTIVPQIESYKNRYQSATCFPHFNRHFVNLVIKASTSSQLLLNGQSFLTATAAKPIPGTDLEAFQYQFDCSYPNNQTISFTLEHVQNASFGALAYGFGDQISYAYPGGMNLDEDLYYKCAQPKLNVTAEVKSEACHLTIASPPFPTPVTMTDDQCCQANSTLTYQDTLIEYNPCIKTIVRSWTLTDGCGRLVQANQTGTMERKLDVYEAPPRQVILTRDAFNEFRTKPEMVECCGTTLSIELNDISDQKTFLNRTWIISQECTNEKTTFNQTFTCAPGFNADQRPCGCFCGHHSQGHGSGQSKKSSLKEWWQIGIFQGAKEAKKSQWVG